MLSKINKSLNLSYLHIKLHFIIYDNDKNKLISTFKLR